MKNIRETFNMMQHVTALLTLLQVYLMYFPESVFSKLDLHVYVEVSGKQSSVESKSVC